MFTAVLLSAAAFQAFGQEQEWVNYSNFTQITDVEPVDGNLWITAKGGVLKLNPTTMEKTYYRKGDAGLPSNSVEQVAVDATSGTIWVGTYDAGVVEWDGDNWLSYDYPVSFLMYRMKADSYGDLWLQTTGGLYKFDSEEHDYTFINSVGGAGWSFEAWDFDITPDDKVLIFTGEDCLVIDAATNMVIDSFPNTESPVVVGCSPATVRIYGVNADTYLINNGSSLEFQFKDGTYGPASAGIPEFAFINDIIRGTDNYLYALVNSSEIYRLNGLEWELVNTLADESSADLFYTDGVVKYLSGGQYYEPPILKKLTEVDVVAYPVQEYNFNSNMISGITHDADGNIFMSSATTIYQFNEVANDWDVVTAVPTIYNSMLDLKYKNGYFYTINNGNLMEYFDGSNWIQIPMADGYTSPYVFDFDITDAGVIYFTNEEGLFKYEAGETVNLIETAAVASWFIAVGYDKVNNLIYLGKTNGLVKYDFVSQEVINSTDVPAFADGASMQIITQDAEGNMWFGANGGKVYRFDGTEWSDYSFGNAEDFITSIEFFESKVYCGIYGVEGGIIIYDKTDGSTVTLNTTVDPEMPSSNIGYLTVNVDGSLWLGHNDNGVSVYKTATPDAINDQLVTSFLIYPNPAENNITIDIQEAQNVVFQIADMQGKMIMESTSNKIDVSELSAGMYFAKVMNTNTGIIATAKFTVLK